MAVLAAVVVLVVVVGLVDRSRSSSNAVSASPASSSNDAAHLDNVAADMLVQASDLGASWSLQSTRVGAPANGITAAASADVFDNCLHTTTTNVNVASAGQAEGSFIGPNGATSTSRVDVYATDDLAKRAYAALATPQFADCAHFLLLAAIQQVVPGDVTVGIDFVPSPVTGVGDEALVVRGTVTLTGPAASVPYGVDFVIARKGRSVALASGAIIGEGSTLDAAIQHSIAVRLVSPA